MFIQCRQGQVIRQQQKIEQKHLKSSKFEVNQNVVTINKEERP